jgi:carbon-monoxide dehydrogenase large subunit/6-hydroxypseudooxynicotine dehydrogenase subunit gamma
MTFVGRSVPRLEDTALLTGTGCFAADLSFAQQIHMRVVRSPHSHAKIVTIATTAASAAAGVVAVWTSADVTNIPRIDFRLGRIEQLEPYRQPILAKDRVRYVGEPVAVVFATDPYLAEDAAELVTLEVEELPALVDTDAQPHAFDVSQTNAVSSVRKEYGDVEAAFAMAHVVITLDLSVGRHSGVPLETRGAIAHFDAALDTLTLYGAAKVPHANRNALAQMLGREPTSIHLQEGHVGGGFGVRGELYPEDVLVCLGALRLGRPIKWIEDRREHLIAANHSREQRFCVRAAVDKLGYILGIDGEFWHDQGAYVRTHGATVPDLCAAMLPGPYRVNAYRMIGHIRLTNKTPCGTYRAPGRFESTFVRERLMDAIAARLEIDPTEIRRRNFIARCDMPFSRGVDTLGAALIYDSGDYAGLLDKALKVINWEALNNDLRRRRASGEAVGVGLAMFVEESGSIARDTVRTTVETSGAIEIVTGAASVGQGAETVIAQICADTLGIDYRQVRVVHGQTNRIAFGLGAFGSRVTVMTGEATRLAAIKLREKIMSASAMLLQSTPDDLDIIDGKVTSRTGSRASVTLAEVARAVLSPSKLGAQGETALSADGWFDARHMTYPYGVHIAVVSVDRETGAITAERYLVGYDIGKAVNPMLVEGQLVGGVVQGIGGAILEEFLYDSRGEPLSVSLDNYLVPTVRDVPSIEVLLTEDAPSPTNPLGLKGAGEGGANAVGAAIAAAIDDALGMPGSVTQLPVTPQRLRMILKRQALYRA